MYCKYCGKEIADDSKFCQYCGGRIDTPILDFKEEDSIENPAEEDNTTPQIVIKTNDNSAIQVELTNKSTDNSSTIANEIVGNLKMVGVAAALFTIYIIGFMLIHQKDITHYDYETHKSYFGESCYDHNTLSGNWEFHWEKHYYDILYFSLYRETPLHLHAMTPEQWLKNAEDLEEKINKRRAEIAEELKRKAKTYNYTEDDIELLTIALGGPFSPESAKEDAKTRAAEEIQDWNNTINHGRQRGYEDDLKKNAIYAAIISLLTMILGRYIIKLIKWVDTNKTTQ